MVNVICPECKNVKTFKNKEIKHRKKLIYRCIKCGYIIDLELHKTVLKV